jgi:hypothetical protein
VKSSTNGGQTWGTGPSDLGTALSFGSIAEAFSQIIFSSPKVFCFYTEEGTTLYYRTLHLSGAEWSSPQTVYTGSTINENFHSDVSSDNRMGIVFPGSNSLLYKEFDGTNWSGVLEVASFSPITPTIKFYKTIPFVFFGKNIGTKQNLQYYSYKKEDSFITPEIFNPACKTFDKVFCYDDSASTKYSDKTAPAESSTPADVFHPTSNGLIKDIEDGLYLGMEKKFNLVKIILSTAGISGQVVWQYWNGIFWQSFIPYSGTYHFDSIEKLVLLWQDLFSVPADWQVCPIEGNNLFWVKISVTTPFTTVPVGSQITAVGEDKWMCVV